MLTVTLLPSPSLTLFLCPSIFSLSHFFSLSLFPPPPLPSSPLNRRKNHPTAAPNKKFEGELLLTVSLLSSPLLPSPSLTLSLCLSIFSLSLLFFCSLSFFPPPPLPLHLLHIHPMHLYLFSPLFFFSLFLTLSYVLMNNSLTLFPSIFSITLLFWMVFVLVFIVLSKCSSI